MAAYKGIRIRLRRTNDNAVLYDSGDPVKDVSDMIVDPAAFVGDVGYVLEAMTVDGPDGSTTPMAEPLCRRQALVAMVLRR